MSRTSGAQEARRGARARDAAGVNRGRHSMAQTGIGPPQLQISVYRSFVLDML